MPTFSPGSETRLPGALTRYPVLDTPPEEDFERPGSDMAREHRPELILLDLRLPDLSGDEVLPPWQADPRTRKPSRCPVNIKQSAT